MPTTTLWLTVKADRTGLEVVLNDIPALRLGESGGVRAPVNEYVVAGRNTVAVKLSPFTDPAAGADIVDVTLTLEAATFEVAAKVGSRPVAEFAVKDAEVAAGPLLLRGGFDYDRGGLPDPAAFRMIAPGDLPLVKAALDEAADCWRTGRVERLAEMLAGYFADYGRAYPQDGAAEMRERFLRMARAFTSGPHEVQYDPATLRLDLCGGGRLVDAYGPHGAPIRVQRPGAPPYDFWTIFGLQAGRAVIVR